MIFMYPKVHVASINIFLVGAEAMLITLCEWSLPVRVFN